MGLPDEPALAALIKVWEERARETHEYSRSDQTANAQTAYYYKGVSDTYRQVLDELKALLPSETQNAASAVPPAYRRVNRQQVAELLHRAGMHPRELSVHSDHAITAVFSRLQPVTQEQRLQVLSAADPLIVILDYGKLPGSKEPYIDFAFRDPDEE